MSTFSKYNATVLFLNYYTSKIFILFFCKCAKNDQKQERIKRIKNLTTKNNQTHAAKEYNIFLLQITFLKQLFPPYMIQGLQAGGFLSRFLLPNPAQFL